MSHTRGGSVDGSGNWGQNVIRKSSKRSRIILGAAVASALAGLTASSASATNYSWVGNAGTSFWDVNTNWSPNTGFPGSADNVTFGSGPVSFAVDLHLDPLVVGSGQQSVNTLLFSNPTGSYNISNGTLTVNGTVSQTGAGTNRISAQVIGVGAWTVSGGSLALTNTAPTSSNNFTGVSMTIGTGASLTAHGGRSGDPTNGGSATGDAGEVSAINGGAIVLNGGTFNARGVLSGQNMLMMSLYPDDNGDQHRYLNEGPGTTLNTGNGLLTRTPAGRREMAGILSYSDMTQPSPFVDVRTISRGAVTDDDNFSQLVSGNLHVTAANAGQWYFATRSDDGSVIWIDRNHNGIYENTGDPATTELVVDNNEYQGPTTRGINDVRQGTPAINLPAGDYNIAIGWYEGGWTGETTAGFISPTLVGDPTLDTQVQRDNWLTQYHAINPSDAAQSGMWSFDNSVANLKYDALYSNSDVTVSASSNSTINVDALSASFHNLSLGNNSTLNVTGTKASFAATSMTGTVTINNSADVSTGPVGNGGGTITRLNKLGTGNLKMTDLGTASGFSAASSISIQAGKVQALSDGTNNTISSATIRLDGGTFVAQSTGGGAGLLARYYNGPNSTALVDPISNLMALTPDGSGVLNQNIQFWDNNNPNNHPAAWPHIQDVSGILGGDNFSVLWSGRLKITAANAGAYNFRTVTDDGSVVWIDLNHE